MRHQGPALASFREASYLPAQTPYRAEKRPFRLKKGKGRRAGPAGSRPRFSPKGGQLPQGYDRPHYDIY